MDHDNRISDIQKKIDQFKSFVELEPENPQLLINIGDLYHKISMCDEACNYYEKSLSIEPSDIVKSRLGAVKITQHQFHDAEIIFQQILDNDKDQPALLFNLALAQYHLRKWDEAIAGFINAMELDADKISCLSFLTRCHHHKHEFRQARKYCSQWQAETDSTTAKGYMALLEMDSGNPAQAVITARAVLELDPDNSDAAIVVGTSHIENQDVEMAENHFNNVLKREQNHPRALFGLGLSYMHRQQHKTAIGYMKQASKLMPTDTGIKIAIGWSQVADNDLNGAETSFRETIDLDRNFAEGHGGLAYVYALKGKMALAKKEMEKALWLDSTSFGAVASKSVIIGYEQGNQKATEYLADALERSPGPGQKPIIEHIQTYVDKYGVQQQANENDE